MRSNEVLAVKLSGSCHQKALALCIPGDGQPTSYAISFLEAERMAMESKSYRPSASSMPKLNETLDGTTRLRFSAAEVAFLVPRALLLATTLLFLRFFAS